MRTHANTLLATLACAAVGLLALPVAGAAAADGSPVLPGDVRAAEHAGPSDADLSVAAGATLPGDVRAAEHARPSSAEPAVASGSNLPGDVRVRDDRASGQVRAAAPVVSTRVVRVDDSDDLLDVGLGALAGMVVASAVAVAVAGRRRPATTA